MRTLISLFSILFFVGCSDLSPTNYSGGDIGGGDTEVNNDTVNASNTSWLQVQYLFLDPNPPADCGTPETFVVSNDSTWKWDWCEQHKTGSITYGELVELNDRAQGVLAAGFVPQVCTELSFPGHAQLSAIFKPDSSRVLHNLDRSGSCYTAPATNVNSLEIYVIQLRAKYTGFDINPLARDALE